MKKNRFFHAATCWKAAWILGFVAMLWLPHYSVVAQTNAQKTAAEAEKKRLKELREKIDTLKQNLSKSEESRGEVADQLKTSEAAISEVNRSLTDLDREQGKISAALGETQKRIQSTKGDVGKQKDLLERMIRHQQMHGNTDQLRLVLDGQDVSVVERRLQYFGYISKTRSAMIVKLNTSLSNLAELESAAKLKNDELAANAAGQKAARLKIEAERAERQKVLSKIQGDIVKNRYEIGRLKRDEDRLTRLVDQLAKALLRKPQPKPPKPAKPPKDNPKQAKPGIQQPAAPVETNEDIADSGFTGRAFKSLQGKLKLPARGELAGRFGSPRQDSGVTWKGLFIKAGVGQPVHAVADGSVVFADWLRGYGNLMIVDHGNGYLSLYGHNESLLKTVGQNIASGEAIASVGSTGGAAESGVYFELRHEGKPFDPMKWVGK